jgi:hypothetical protein
MHSAVTYSGLGGWYYIEGSPEKLSIFGLVFFGLTQSFMQAWIMGILFFISAYLATKALAKRTSLTFIKERLFRLGLPLLLYVFIVSPFIQFIILGYYPENNLIDNYFQYITKFSWISSTEPLWFVQVLLVLCIIYAVLKKCFSNGIIIKNITNKNIIFTIIIITIFTFLVRLVFQVGSSFYNLQLSYFTSYIVMFIAGIIIGENNLLENISDEKNTNWIKLSLIIGLPLWFFLMLFGGALEGKTYYNGGLYWQNFAFALWESLTAIGFSIGIIAFFRKKVNINNKFTGLMRDNAFGIYFFHAPILITISIIFKHWSINSILKFAFITIITSIICLGFSYFIRKIKAIEILFK